MLVPRRRAVEAWVFYWRNEPGAPAFSVSDLETVAVLPVRSSEKTVKETLRRLFLERAASPAELVAWRRSADGPYLPMHGAYIHRIPYSVAFYCGHNPMLVARQVENLVVEDELTISWDEVGPTHYSVESCRSVFRVDNCPEAGKAPHRVRRTWRASTCDGR
jgi:hypothetical protein